MLVRAYRASDRYTRLAESTRKEYDRHLAHVWNALHEVDVTIVKTRHVVSILAKFSETPTLQDAIRRTLSVVFNYARDVEEWIESNPAERAGTTTRRKRRGSDAQGDRADKSQKPLEEHEVAAVRAANPLGTRRRAVFEALLATGLRRADVQRIPVAGLASATFPFVTNKTGQTVHASVTKGMREACRAWIAEASRERRAGSDCVFANAEGAPIHKRTVSKDLAECFEAAGMPSRGVHSTRYTTAVRLAETGSELDDIAAHLGHSKARMAQHYVRSRRAARLRVAQIDAIDAVGPTAP
jgi:site-specific recombinase XerD